MIARAKAYGAIVLLGCQAASPPVPAAAGADAAAVGIDVADAALAAAPDTPSGSTADAAPLDAVDGAGDVSPAWASHLVASQGVSLFYSQGIARLTDGWAFSAKAGLWRTDLGFTQLVEVTQPLPQSLLDAGYGHIGDIDLADQKLFAALEQGDDNRNKQAVAWFDPQTLAFIAHADLPQHENPCLCVDEATRIAYTPDRYHGNDIRRYDVKNAWAPLGPLLLSQKLDAMQGIDAAEGALWFSCEDAEHGIYRAAIATGEVTRVGSIGRLELTGTTRPEVEGIDATLLPSGLLHILTNEPLQATSWVDDFAVDGP